MMFIPSTYYAMHVSLLKRAYKVMNGFILHITCTYVKLAKIIFSRIFQQKISVNRLALVGMVGGRGPQLG